MVNMRYLCYMSILNRGWLYITVLDKVTLDLNTHLVPFEDSKSHELTTDCHCVVELDEDGTILHNSFDGREHIEALLDMSNMVMN